MLTLSEIRLAFVLAPGISSAAIAAFSAGHLSHVDAEWGTGGWLLGARSDRVGGKPRGVQCRPPDYEIVKRRVVFTLAVSAYQQTAWASFLAEQLGKPYDRAAIWAFALNRNWRAADSWICSELQARALEVAGIVPTFYLAANKITPVALALAISAVGARIVPAGAA